MKNLTDKCRCVKKNKTVTLEKCLNSLVKATAFKKVNSDCYECPYGHNRRERFSRPVTSEDETLVLPRNLVRKKFRRFSD